MALVAGTLYEALCSFTSSTGVFIAKGDLRLGSKTDAASEFLWIVAGSSEAEKVAAARAAGIKGP